MADTEKWEWYNGCSYWRLGIAGDQSKHDAILRAYVASDGHPDIDASPEHRRLIAAAPDLLQALIAMRAFVPMGRPALRDKVNAAIAKAEGR